MREFWVLAFVVAVAFAYWLGEQIGAAQKEAEFIRKTVSHEPFILHANA